MQQLSVAETAAQELTTEVKELLSSLQKLLKDTKNI
jgi:hypothetical protein